MRTALIDADLLVYRAAIAAEKSVDFDGDGVYSLFADVEEAKSIFTSLLNDAVNGCRADKAVLALSDSSANFRQSVFPDYKRKRRAMRTPLVHGALREWARETFDVREKPALEADDVLGIMATTDVKGVSADKVICSIDKDMKTIPGLHFNWNYPEEGVFEITEAEALRRFYAQTLIGDSTDGYPGCPNIGDVRAWCIFRKAPFDESPFDEVAAWERVVAEYVKKDRDEEFALSQARCARILWASDYDFEKQEVRLWTPPSMN